MTIPDYKVDAAANALRAIIDATSIDEPSSVETTAKRWARAALEAAAAAQEPPQIEVTEEMVRAGFKAHDSRPDGILLDVGSIYRAMRAVEPKRDEWSFPKVKMYPRGENKVTTDERSGKERRVLKGDEYWNRTYGYVNRRKSHRRQTQEDER